MRPAKGWTRPPLGEAGAAVLSGAGCHFPTAGGSYTYGMSYTISMIRRSSQRGVVNIISGARVRTTFAAAFSPSSFPFLASLRLPPIRVRAAWSVVWKVASCAATRARILLYAA